MCSFATNDSNPYGLWKHIPWTKNILKQCIWFVFFGLRLGQLRLLAYETVREDTVGFCHARSGDARRKKLPVAEFEPATVRVAPTP